MSALVSDLASYLAVVIPVGAGVTVLLWSAWRGRRD